MKRVKRILIYSSFGVQYQSVVD